VVQRHRLDPGQRRLGRALRGAQESGQAGLPRALGRRKHTANRPQSPVQRELAYRRMATERLGRHLARRRQHRERDREVEPRAFLPQLGRREIDRDPAHGPLELR
jgi:hypothetical protein